MAGLWDKIKADACLKTGNDLELPVDGRDVYLSQKTFEVPPPSFIGPAESRWWDKHWVIGSYSVLTDLAIMLKSNPNLRNDLTGIGAAYGRRHDDVPRDENPNAPVRFTKGKKRDMRASVVGQASKDWHDPFSAEMKAKKLPRAGDNPSQDARLTDLYDPAKAFYKNKTLEAHHIVEKSILGKLGLNDGDLDDNAAPCVLASAELHQRFFTPALREYRDQFTAPPSDLDPEKMKKFYGGAADRLQGIYDNLYTGEFEPLQDIATIIIKRVRQGKKTT